jgi:glycosyltransferase involved in cell wall biosynthesis
MGISSLNEYFVRAIKSSNPDRTIAYFWPSPPLSLLRCARQCGLITVREMINTFLGTSRAILNEAYDRVGLVADHGISPEIVAFEREELALYDYIFASNPLVEASLLEAGVPPARIMPSSFGWSPARFTRAETATIRQEKKMLTGLFVGSVGVRKGVPQLLDAWKKSGVQGELLLAGFIEDSIKAHLRQYVDNVQIRLLGFVSDVAPLYRSADIFIFPSLEEGGPQVTYEAAGFGLPIITTPMGAGRIIKNGINGFVIEPYDIEGVASAIVRLAESKELRQRLGERAKLDAQHYTYERVGLDRGTKMARLLKYS